MNENELYSRFKTLAIAHTNTVEWKELHCFAVGYIHELNTGNMNQSAFRKDYFYSEKWWQKGKNPNELLNDYPMALMLPVTESGDISRDGLLTSPLTFKCTLFIIDLLFNDRNGNKETAYSKRSREEIWNTTKEIGRQLLREYNKKYFKSVDKKKSFLANNGKYTGDSVYEYANGRFAGSMLEFEVTIPSDCEDGVFDYTREFPENKEKPSC